MPKVAVIDDDPVVIELLTKLLREAVTNCEVTPYADLESALDGIASDDYDLVISDVDLGNGADKYGGVQIAKALDTTRSPLLVVSGYTVQVGVFRALGAWDYLQKPVSEVEFKTVVKRALVYRRGMIESDSAPAEAGFPLVPELKVDTRSRTALVWKGQKIHLAMSKIDIVTALARRAGNAVSKKELFDCIASGKNDRNLRVKISEIREEFKSVDEDFDCIQPVVMNGYLWRVD
jgi:DNA-binding response OmpR family regulator